MDETSLPSCSYPWCDHSEVYHVVTRLHGVPTFSCVKCVREVGELLMIVDNGSPVSMDYTSYRYERMHHQFKLKEIA